MQSPHRWVIAGSVGAQTPAPHYESHALEYRTVDAVPDATTTNSQGINARGDIVGSYPLATKTRAFLSSISAVLLMAAPAFAQGYTYIPIDVRCDPAAASCPAGLAPGGVARQTSARGINARGDIVGSYNDAANVQHGFLLQDGNFTTIDFPLVGVRATIANGINPQGEIVGQYVAPINTDPTVPEDSPLYCPNGVDAACIKGFHYRRGHYSTVLYPGHPGAIPQRITSDGDIYGCLHDHDTGMSMFGSAWTRVLGPKDSVHIQGTFSLADNGGQLSDSMGVPMSMNNGATPGGGQTTIGLFVDMGGVQHGYKVRNGMFEPYDPTPDTSLSATWDINPSQQFVGTYRKVGEPAAKRHGFLQSADAPEAVNLDVSFKDPAGNMVTAFATVGFGINPAGVIVGQYALIAGGPLHGFMAVRTFGN